MNAGQLPLLIPLALPSHNLIDSAIDELDRAATRAVSFPDLLATNWKKYRNDVEAPFALAFVAGTLDELRDEIQVCRRTWHASCSAGRDWMTPAGSYLSLKPVGKEGKVAFVFPGIGSLYPGYSRDLERVFPGALDNLPSVSRDELLSMIHPEALWQSGDLNESWSLQSDIVSQAESTVSLAYVWTHLLGRSFQLRPAVALGYSLGEIAMFAACGCWDRPQDLSARFREGSSFRQALSGSMSVLQKSAELRDIRVDQWQACVASLPDALGNRADTGSKAFITHINTPREVVVAGESGHVADWLQRHQARGQVAPTRLVYHCRAVAPEAATLQGLFEMPVASRPAADLVAMAPFARVPHNSKLIARTLVNTAMNTVDFPQIVQTAYQRGARIFVEVGPRNHCSTWIQQILSGQSVLTVSTDHKGFDSATSVVRMLAKLMTHRVPLSLDGAWAWIQTLLSDAPDRIPTRFTTG